MSRKNEISILNVLFCMLVIFIHCTGGGVSLLPYNNLMRAVLFILWKLSSFVVQGFIFLSAMKHFMKENTKSYGAFVLDKIKRIFLPYVFWCVVYYFSYIAIKVIPEYNTSRFINGIFIGDICGHFYYIIAIMQFYLLFPLWKKIIRKDNMILVLPLSIFISAVCTMGLPSIVKTFFPNCDIIYNDRIFTTYFVYWVMGCYAGMYYEEFKKLLLNNKPVITITWVIVAFLASYLPYAADLYGYSFSFLTVLHMMYSIVAILFTYMLALFIKDTKFANSAVLRSVDRSSYGIYLCHCLILSLVDVYIVLENNMMPLDATGIRYLIVYPSAILLCCIYTYICGLVKKKALK